MKISLFDTLDTDRLRFAGFLYGAFLVGVGVLLHQRRIKAHFLDVYLQLGANALLLAAVSGVLEPDTGWAYLVVLLAFAAAAIYLGVRYRRFAFVAYGTLYGYAGLSVRLLDALRRGHRRAHLLRRHRIDRRNSARGAGAKIRA